MNGHDINTCRRSQNNGGKGNNNNQQGQQNQQKGNQNHSEPCLQCGGRGHKKKNCHAHEVPPGEECDCGCAYHTNSNHCPWNRSEEQRQAAINDGRGMICQWCKDTADGTHVFDDCPGPREFQRNMLKIIHRAYDVIKWCWHCSNVNHYTVACTSNSATQGKAKWNTKISAIIDAWVNSTADLENLYRENDQAADAINNMDAHRRPPEAAEYLWCILCEEFGHKAKQNPAGACNMREFEARCPAKFRDQLHNGRRRRSSGGNVPDAGGLAGGYNPAPKTTPWGVPIPQSYADDVRHHRVPANCVCCNTRIGNWSMPINKFKPTVLQCPSCGETSKHPQLKNGHEEAMEMLKVVGGIFAGNPIGNPLRPQRQTRKQLVDATTPDLFKKRPSWALSKKLALLTWPDTQPVYNDWRHFKNKSPVFATDFQGNNGYYFNQPGNFQLYFPATKFSISHAMWVTLTDKEAPINKAGRLGMELRCANCGARGVIVDDEGDVVMCAVDGWCTIGMGYGHTGVWQNGYAQMKKKCDCLSLIGQTTRSIWTQMVM